MAARNPAAHFNCNGVTTMKGSIRLASTACLLLASVAAHAVDDTYVFDRISSVEHYNDSTALIMTGTILTGVLANGSVPTSITVPANTNIVGARCADYYDVMLKKQGVHALSLTIRTVTFTGPGGFPQTTIELLKCSLTRNP
jgi:hypothetical protein